MRSLFRSLMMIICLALSGPTIADDAHWIDVRTADEFSTAHVDGAINIPYEEITARIAEVTTDPGDRIYVYCRSGRRSGIAKDALEAAGFNNVVNLGGYEDALEAAGKASR